MRAAQAFRDLRELQPHDRCKRVQSQRTVDERLETCKQRWLDHGYNVAEVKHEFIHSIYTRDPDGTLVEFTFDTQPLTEVDEREAEELLADDTPAQVPEYEGVQHRSPHFQARREAEKAESLAEAGAAI